MIVASFYTPRPQEYPDKQYDFDELLMLLDKSCKKLDFKHMVISDEPRPKPLNTYLTYLPKNLMEAFLYGQMSFLREVKEEVLFVGADCLLTRDPRPFFQSDLTITTSSTFSDCKMNTGAIFVKNTKLCLDVWIEALELEPKDWGDDQKCLYKMIKEYKGLDFKELRCEEHNWAPDDLNDNAHMATVVHFRGKRKSFMKDWASKYLGIN